jgi:hypothetical protein
MLPDVDDQHLARGQRKQGALALKVLVFAALATVCALNIHDQDVLALVLAHPYSLCSLAALLLGHDAELGAEEVVEQRGLARGLRAEDGYEVVVEAGGDDLLDPQVGAQVGAAAPVSSHGRRGERADTDLNSLSSSMTWMPCSYSSRVASWPTRAMWAFIIREGAEGCLTLLGRPLPLTLRESAMVVGPWRHVVG